MTAAAATGRPVEAGPARTDAAKVILAVFAWLAATAWLRPLTLPDEGRYAGVAWEMLTGGRWAVPTLGGLPFFHKPPLFYWLGAGAMKLLGASPWAARMPSLLGATLAIGALYLFTRRWSGVSHARWSAVLLATAPFFCVGAQFANLDMLVAGCITATVLLGAHAALLTDSGASLRDRRAALWSAYAMAGLGVLAKGLIGFVLPGGVLLAWLLATRRPRLILSLLSLPGLVAFLVVAAPWFVDMQRRYPGFYDYFFVYQHFRRFTAGGFNNQQPVWFYLPVLAGLLLPWTLLLPAAVRLRESDRSRPSIVVLMWCWFAVVTLFFSLPRSKLVGYVLPAVPPLGWLLSAALAPGAAHAGRLGRHGAKLAVVAAVVTVAAVVGVAFAKLNSARSLGLLLREQHRPGEPVIALKTYPYDLPFYARLDSPPIVVDDWDDPAVPQRDDWRKELYDAGLFDRPRAASQLVRPADLPSLLCARPRSWLVGPPQLAAQHPEWAGHVEEAGRTRWLVLWRFSCAGTPSGG